MASASPLQHASSGARRLIVAAITAFLVLVAAGAGSSTATAAMTVSTTSSTSMSSLVFYISKNSPSVYATQYVGIKVVNDATPRSDLWISMTDVSGGHVTRADGEEGRRHVGPLAASGTKVVYFLFKASGKTTNATPDTTFNVKLHNGPPNAGGELISTHAGAFTDVTESQNASANKVTGGYVSPPSPVLASDFKVVVTGETGIMANNGVAVFTPAFAKAWDPAAFELVGTELTFDNNPAGNRTFTDQLRFSTTNSPSSVAGTAQIGTANSPYTATYTFRAVNRTNISYKPSPVGHLQSGGIMKYTNASSLSNIAPIQPVTNSFLITASVSPEQSASGLLTYTLTLANTSTRTLSVDLIRDVIPAGTTYVAGSSSYEASAIPDPSTADGARTWSGPFTVSGGARATLTYRVQANSVTSTATEYANSATGRVGETRIDTTLDTSDDAPATATATVDSDFDPDTAAPVITLTGEDGLSTAITNGSSTSSRSATMDFSADEDATWTCSMDGAAPTSCSSPGDYTGLSSGSHTFWVYAKDAAGNTGSTSLKWTVIDTSKPEVDSFQPTVTTSKTSPLSYSLTFTKPVTGLTASDVTVVTTGSPGTWTIASLSGSDSTYAVSLTSASPGTSGTVAVRIAADAVVDAANGSLTGPTSATTSGAVTMSNSLGLEITAAAPVDGTLTNATTATFSFGPTDGKYPPDQYMCRGPGASSYTECTSPITYTGITAGAKTFSVYGNELNPDTEAVVSTTEATPLTSSWTVDLTPPSVTLTSPLAGALLADNTPALAGACTTSDGTVSIPLYPGASASGTPAQTATATCASSPWTVDAATLADGQYTAQAKQTDAAGNTGTSSARTFTIDTTAPTATVTANAATTTTGSASFAIAFDEPVTGFANDDLIIGGTSASPAWTAGAVTGSGASYAVTLTTGTEPALGTVTLKVRAGTVSDATGNTGPASDSPAASIEVVTTGDLVDGAVTANDGKAWGATRSLAVSKTTFREVGGTASNELFRLVAPWGDGAGAGDCGSFDAGTLIDLSVVADDTSALGDRCYRYELRAKNQGGSKQVSAVSNTVKVDLTAPTLGSLAVASGDNQLTRTARPAIAKGSASDAASGLDTSAEKLTRVSSSLSAGACSAFPAYDAGTEAAVTPAEDGTEPTALGSACYRYTHRVGDVAGNRTTQSAVVRVDVTDPTGGAVSANGGSASWTKDANPTLTAADFTDVHSGLATGTRAFTRGFAAFNAGGTCGGVTYAGTETVTIDGGGRDADAGTLPEGCYRYTQSMRDVAGNSAARSATVYIDRTAPTGGSVTAAGGVPWTSAAQPSVGGSPFSDANSGVASSVVTRARATLTGSACGTFGDERAVTITGGADADDLDQACYRYTRTATDHAGNSASSSAAVVKIDRTAPTGGTVAVARTGGTWANTPRPAISGDPFIDANSDVDPRSAVTRIVRERAEYIPDGNTCAGTWVTDKDPVIITDGRDADALGEACYRYTRHAADNAGNTAETTPDTVQLDLTGPTGGAVAINGGTDVDGTEGTPPTITLEDFQDRLSGLAADSERLTRRIAPWVGSAGSASAQGGTRAATRSEFGDYGTPEPVVLFGDEDPAAVTPGRYFYEYEATDTAGNTTTRTALIEIRPAGYSEPDDPAPVTPPMPTVPLAPTPSAPLATQQEVAPALTAAIVPTRRRVRSGQVVPVTIVVTNSGGATGPMMVSIRLRAGMSLAQMPPGSRLRDGQLLMPVGALGRGEVTRMRVFLRLTSTRTRKTIIPARVHRAGTADIITRSPVITVVAVKRTRGVTG